MTVTSQVAYLDPLLDPFLIKPARISSNHTSLLEPCLSMSSSRLALAPEYRRQDLQLLSHRCVHRDNQYQYCLRHIALLVRFATERPLPNERRRYTLQSEQ